MDKMHYNLIDADKAEILVKEVKMIRFDVWANIEINYKEKKGLVTYVGGEPFAQITSPDVGDGIGILLDLTLSGHFKYSISEKIKEEVMKTIKKEFFYHNRTTKGMRKIPVTLDFEVERKKLQKTMEAKAKEAEEVKEAEEIKEDEIEDDEFVKAVLDAFDF